VRCFTPAGQPVDSKFTALFVTPAQHLAYAIAHQPTTPSYFTLLPFTWHPLSPGNTTVTRTGVGTYRVHWAGIDPEIVDYGNVQVTAWGTDATQCRANHITGINDDFADVMCFGPNGAPADSRFNVLLGS
jgi:hypothetical protein